MFQNNNSAFGDLPVVTKNLIIINALVWFATITLPRILHIDLYDLFGLHFPIGHKFYPHQLFTYMFLHANNLSHLFFNMFSLFMFGRTLEMVWGPKRFLIYYVVTGLGAGLVQELAWLFTYREPVFAAIDAYASGSIAAIADYPVNVMGMGMTNLGNFLDGLVTVGASGAVFGILLAFGMLFPDAELFIWFVPIPVKAKYFVIGYGAIELFAGVTNFSFDNIAHFAHLGGMLFGFILIKYWRKKNYNNGRYFF